MFHKLLIYVKKDKFLLLIPLLTVVVRLIIFLFIPHTYEDAFITFRYAENFANGNGLVYNLGEHVYGTTVPLFALILGCFKYIGISCVISSLIINMLSEGVTSLIIYKFLKDYSNTSLAAVLSLLYVFSPSNISWSIQGMETAFFTALIALAFFSLYKNKYFLAFLFGFLCSVLRIDGLSVPFVIFIFVFANQKFKTFKYLAFPLTIFLIWEVFLFSYFHSFLPNSMIAKLVLYAGHQKSMLPGLNLLFSKFFVKGYYTSSVMSILFLAGIFISIKKQPKYLPVIIWFFVYYVALIISKTDIFAWYLIPPLFVFITISGITLITITYKIRSYFNLKYAISILMAGIILFSSFTLYLKIVQVRYEHLYETTIRENVGEFLNHNTPEKSTVFLEPIGVIGYYSHRYIYDDAALISPQFLELNRLPNIPETRYKKIKMVKPDYLVLRDKYLGEFSSKTDLYKEYKVVKNYKFKYKSHLDYLDLTIFKRK